MTIDLRNGTTVTVPSSATIEGTIATATDIFACDECGHTYVAVNDPYGTCSYVACAACNGGHTAAGPILAG